VEVRAHRALDLRAAYPPGRGGGADRQGFQRADGRRDEARGQARIPFRSFSNRSQGTIIEARQIGEAVAAGATFLVSPGASPRLAESAASAPIPFLPGVATPSEAIALRDLGFRALKLFPAEAVGGAKLLAAFAAPLSDLVFCPTGGIDLAKAPSYLALPNVICVGGSWMLPKAALEARDYARVETLSREAAGLRT